MCLGKIKSLISFSKLFLGIKMNNFVVLLIYMSILLASWFLFLILIFVCVVVGIVFVIVVVFSCLTWFDVIEQGSTYFGSTRICF